MIILIIIINSGRATMAQKLRIYSAGIWHNFILSFFAYLIFSIHPMLLSPFYSQNNGVMVDGMYH